MGPRKDACYGMVPVFNACKKEKKERKKERKSFFLSYPDTRCADVCMCTGLGLVSCGLAWFGYVCIGTDPATEHVEPPNKAVPRIQNVEARGGHLLSLLYVSITISTASTPAGKYVFTPVCSVTRGHRRMNILYHPLSTLLRYLPAHQPPVSLLASLINVGRRVLWKRVSCHSDGWPRMSAL